MDEVRDELARDLRRVASRLRSVPPRRLDSPAGAHPTADAAARALLTALADLTAGLEALPAGTAPARRTVPDLGPGALGDQLDVLGADLLAALREVPGTATVGTPAGPRSLDACLADLATGVRDLRTTL